METNRLKQFCVIAETGSITKASQLLHITHSGLSKSMKILQEELGYVLLRPSGRGLALTDEGLKIYRHAKEFLEHEDRLFKFPTTTQSKLKIGTVEIFLFAMMEKFKNFTFEKMTLSFLDLDPGRIEHMIQSKQIDYGITYVPFPSEYIEVTDLGSYSLGCYHLKGKFTGKDITEIPFVVPEHGLSNNPLGIKERDGWLDSIFPRNKKYFTNLLSTAIELTLQGVCAIYIPDFVAKKINSTQRSKNILIEFPLPRKQKNLQTAFLLRHKDQPEDSNYKQLFKILRNTIAKI